jgi:hypothetical protein
VERYAAAVGVKVTWHLEPAPRAKDGLTVAVMADH